MCLTPERSRAKASGGEAVRVSFPGGEHPGSGWRPAARDKEACCFPGEHLPRTLSGKYFFPVQTRRSGKPAPPRLQEERLCQHNGAASTGGRHTASGAHGAGLPGSSWEALPAGVSEVGSGASSPPPAGIRARGRPRQPPSAWLTWPQPAARIVRTSRGERVGKYCLRRLCADPRP